MSTTSSTGAGLTQRRDSISHSVSVSTLSDEEPGQQRSGGGERPEVRHSPLQPSLPLEQDRSILLASLPRGLEGHGLLHNSTRERIQLLDLACSLLQVRGDHLEPSPHPALLLQVQVSLSQRLPAVQDEIPLGRNDVTVTTVFAILIQINNFLFNK